MHRARAFTAHMGTPHAGFSLLELGVVLLVISALMGAAVTVGLGKVDEAKEAQTRAKLEYIHTALAAFARVQKRLPCPASYTSVAGDAGYGQEVDDAGRCTAAPRSAAGVQAVEGAVPYQTLGLTEEFMLDGWGRRIFYAVDTRMTEPEAFETYNIYDNCGSLTVQDATGAARSETAMYVLGSFGANGHGAYQRDGTRHSSDSANLQEQTNCHCDSAAADTAFDATYVQQSGTSTFDDVLRYKERWQVQLDGDLAQARYTGPDVGFALTAAPYAAFYSKTCDTYTRLSLGTTPAGTGHGVAVSADGNYWAVAHSTSPYLTVYDRNTSTGALNKIDDPATLPAGTGNAVAFSPKNAYVAVGHADGAATTYLSVYALSGGALTYLTGTDGPQSQPSAEVKAVAFSPGDQLLAVGYDTSVTIYTRSGDAFTATGTVAPGGTVQSLAFSPNSRYLAVGHASGTRVYSVDYTATPASLSTFDTVADSGGVSFDRKGRYLAVAYAGGAASLAVYRVDTVAGELVAVPGVATYNNANAVAFSPRQHNLVLAGGAADYATAMKYIIEDHVFTLQPDQGDTPPTFSEQPEPGGAVAVAVRPPLIRRLVTN